ncbi:MAG TPA: lantibiotic dehydratase [Chthoniobacterales bacterium]|nr:lantibiotic dehydratase [Chthoniobacterales bacterium]
MSSYEVAPLFLIRAAGVPFDHLERLGTPETAALARHLLAQREALAIAKADAERLIGSRESGLSGEASRAYRASLKSLAPIAFPPPHPREMQLFADNAAALCGTETKLETTLQRELDASRRGLLETSAAVLPGYLVFGAGSFGERVNELLETSGTNGPLPARNARARERERHLLLYLQRVCAKNDTFSEFGPSAWGTIRADAASVVSLRAEPGIKRRQAFLERWAAHALAAAINADASARPQLSPRINPNGRIEGNEFVASDSGARIQLSEEALEVVRRCNGETSASSLGAADGLLEELAGAGVIRWQAEVPALQSRAFDVIVQDIERWAESATRTQWIDRAQSIASLPDRFAQSADAASRTALMAEARAQLDALGARQAVQRSLYAAANPIAEECFRACEFSVSNAITEELTGDIEPWLNLWRDTYAFVASRVAEGLRGLLQTAPVENGSVSLPAFLQHCAANRLPLTGHGIVAMAVIAFQEVKAAFRTMLADRAEAPEWQLRAEDCAFVRRNFEFPSFDEYTYPSADLQISAASIDAVERGDYRWVVSELHPPVAMMHHALYWSCPDPAELSKALASTTFGRPGVHYGFFAADFTAHTAVRLMDVLPDLTTFVAPERANPKWRRVNPADAEVYVVDETGDVCIRRRDSHEHLGSFARAWVIPLGFHPFQFGRAGHMPRLCCGKAVVQRRTWTVAIDELTPGNYTGVSRDLVLAIEKLRAAKEWPRYVYIRPTEQALRRSGAENRDKDTKPVYIDLESYLSLEIFHRWLSKAGELEVTEMLPDPDHLMWREADGRRTFEMRTQIVPRA